MELAQSQPKCTDDDLESRREKGKRLLNLQRISPCRLMGCNKRH
jgi:hypothetical protein